MNNQSLGDASELHRQLNNNIYLNKMEPEINPSI